jgi:hypothetical protein
MSAIAAGSRLPQGLVVSAALVGGPPRRDAFDCGADCVCYRRGVAPPTQGLVVSAAFVGGSGRRSVTRRDALVS